MGLKKSAKPPKVEDQIAARVAALEESQVALSLSHARLLSHVNNVEQRALSFSGRSGIKGRLRWLIMGK